MDARERHRCLRPTEGILSMAKQVLFKSSILSEIDGAIYFRAGAAERFPDDHRNAQCVEGLTRLKDNLEQIADDDSRLTRCFEAYRERHSAAGNLDKCWLHDSELWFPKSDAEQVLGGYPAKQVFSRYGFDWEADGAPDDFLESLLSEIEGWDADNLAFDEG